MTPYGFLAWVATQGIKHIPKKFLLQAFNSFKGKFPSNQVILKTAKNLWNDVIKKTSTPKIADKVRQKIKPIIPKQFNKFEPKIVKNKWTDKHGQTWMRDEKGNPIQITEGLGKYKWWKAQADVKRKIVPKKPKTLGDALKTAKYTKVPTPKNLTPKGPAEIIPLFPKKPPTLKADGGSVDKALPKRSRDI